MKINYTILAFAVLFLFIVLPSPEGLSKEGEMTLGILAMAVILWITDAIPVAATGLLIMGLQPLLGIMPATNVFSNFGNDAIFFVMSAFILAAALEKYNVHKRMALRMLKFFGVKPKRFIFGIIVSSAILSFIMLSHAVAMLLLPIIVSILLSVKAMPKKSNLGIASMLSIAYGSSIGSWGTLLGGARNPLTVAIIAETGHHITFLEWMIYSVPLVIISIPIVAGIILFLYPPEESDMKNALISLEGEVKKMGKIRGKELHVAVVYSITALMWIFLSSYINMGVIALIGASLLFIFQLITWDDIEKRVQWGIILLYGGAITIGKSLEATSAAEWLTSQLTGIVGLNPWMVLFFIIIITIFFTNMMSNTAAVAAILPIGMQIAMVKGINPVIAGMSIAMAGGIAFLFVISTPSNAIVYSSGYISRMDMIKAGLITSISLAIILILTAFFYWQALL
ncbi:MAG: DASS family sodium-coupled anion symporter [Thermoplasmata archaeon]|nr:DASS family sodium-coupled anion symporter [Thermoplasmata archaeon]